MRLTDENIKSFQAIYKNRFGMELSREEAIEKGSKALRLMELVYKPMTKEEYARTKERQAYIAEKFNNTN